MTGRASAETLPAGDDYKAIVCLFLQGGNDSFNMLVPRDDTSYGEYATIRSDLALPQESLLPITPATDDGRQYGLHPNIPEIRDLFAAGNLSFVANVGSLVERIDPAVLSAGGLQNAISTGQYPVPLGIYSHSDQAAHWHTSVPDGRGTVGWGGRTADLLQSLNTSDHVGMGISIDGNNILQSGQNVAHYTIGPDGSEGLAGYGTSTLFTGAVDSILNAEYQNVLRQSYAQTTRDAIAADLQFSSALESTPDLTTSFPATQFGARLRMIARTIGARNELGMRRQTFFIENRGWDHHDELLDTQADMLTELSQSVAAFWNALTELGMQDEVLLFTASDFGRTLTSNGQGSDHAWGGNHFILGGAPLKGGDIFGSYPELALGNNLDTGRGRLLPTTSVDEYFSELACWLGVSNTDLPTVFPNLTRFYTPGVDDPPLGFLA